MRRAATFFSACLLSGCAAENAPRHSPDPFAAKITGAHTGEKTSLDDYYALTPDCKSQGYAEVAVVKSPRHGTVSTGNGEGFPNFAKDNVRYECNRKVVPVTELFYQSKANFLGTDSFTVEIRFATNVIKTMKYMVRVR